MINRGVLAAGALVVLANGAILANVARNRAGNPDAVVRLSEREAQVLRLLGSTEQDAIAEVRLIAESPGTTIVTATTTNASTRSGQPLIWRGIVIVR